MGRPAGRVDAGDEPDDEGDGDDGRGHRDGDWLAEEVGEPECACDSEADAEDSTADPEGRGLEQELSSGP